MKCSRFRECRRRDPTTAVPKFITGRARGKPVPWCFDDGDVPVHHDAASLLIPDSVRFTLLAIAAHLPSPGRGIELSGVIDVHEDSGSDEAKVLEVGFLVVKHREWRLHFEPLTRSPVLEICTHHEQLPLYGRWKAAVFEHTPAPSPVWRTSQEWSGRSCRYRSSTSSVECLQGCYPPSQSGSGGFCRTLVDGPAR